MRKIRLLWPGKTKSGFIREGISEYIKFLKTDAIVEIIEFREGSGSRQQVIEEESQRLLEKAPENFILLDEKGENFSSLEFAEFVRGENCLNFAIGGVFGLSAQAKDRAGRKIALSKMTLTHEMSRLLLLEQLYRAFSIIKGKKYHY